MSKFKVRRLWEKFGPEPRDFILNGIPEGYPKDTSIRYRAHSEALVHSLSEHGLVTPVPLFTEMFPMWSRLTDLGRDVYEHGKRNI